MTHIDCPACDQPIAVDLPLHGTIRCDECLVAWATTEPESSEVRLAA